MTNMTGFAPISSKMLRVLSQTLDAGDEPVAVLLDDRVARDVVGLGVVDHVQDDRRLDDPILDGLRERVVADDPREVDARLKLRRR